MNLIKKASYFYPQVHYFIICIQSVCLLALNYFNTIRLPNNYDCARFIQKMSRKQSKQKNEKKITTKEPSINFNLDDFLSKAQKISTEAEILLSSSQVQHLNAEHQLLISSASMSQVLKTFDKEISPFFDQTSNPEMIKLYSTWREWMQTSIAKNNSQMRQLVQKLVENEDKEKRKNPADDYEKRKSHIISREIRQREQFFKVKTNFAAYAEDNFKKQTQQIRDLVDFKAQRIQEPIVKQMFKIPQQQKLSEIQSTFVEQEKEQQSRLVFLMKEASKLKKLNAEKKAFLIGQRQRKQMNMRRSACEKLGNSVCMFLNLHDVMIFSKK